MNTAKHRLDRFAHTVIKGGENRKDMLGMSGEAFRSWIASRLPGGIAFEDFGKTWVLGRIVPAHLFDLDDPNEAGLYNRYPNFAPVPKELLKLTALSYGLGAKLLSRRRSPSASGELRRRLVDHIDTLPTPES